VLISGESSSESISAALLSTCEIAEDTAFVEAVVVGFWVVVVGATVVAVERLNDT